MSFETTGTLAQVSGIKREACKSVLSHRVRRAGSESEKEVQPEEEGQSEGQRQESEKQDRES